MKKIRWKRVFGLSFIWLGIFLFIINPINNITGFAIANSIPSFFGVWIYALGLGFIVLGFLFLSRDESILEGKIITGYKDQPLRWQEEYPKLREDILKWYNKEHIGTILEGNPEEHLRRAASKYFQEYAPNSRASYNVLKDYIQREILHTFKEKQYDHFIAKNNFIKNEAARVIFSGEATPQTRDEIEKIAEKCGYDIKESSKERKTVWTKNGRFITTLGNHKRTKDLNLQKSRLKDMARGESSFRKNSRVS